MREFLDLIRFTNGFEMGGAVIRLVLAVLCGGVIGMSASASAVLRAFVHIFSFVLAQR